MKKCIILAFGISVLMLLLFFGLGSRQKHDGNNIVFGIATGYAPFISINQNGECEGFDIDVAYEIGKQLNKKTEFQDLGSTTSLFVALQEGMIDAIIWGLSITKERQKKVKMIQYQGETVTAYPLLFWEKIPDNIKSISDMAGMTICVEAHSSQEAVLDRYPGIMKKSVEKVDDALLNIQYKKADAAFVEPAIAQKFKKKFPELILLDVPLVAEDQVHGIGIAVLYRNEELTEKIERAIAAMKRSGIIETLEKKWGII
jgi:arginine transport system substrate-binding protein